MSEHAPPAKSGFSFSALTSKKVKGIPVVYLVLGIAVVALYAAFRLKPSADTTAPVSADGTGDIAGDGVDTSQPVFQATPVITQPTNTSVGVSGTAAPDTDDAWKRRAIEYLIANHYPNQLASGAITKYLNGDDLTPTEAGARDKAVQQFGLPPESIPAGGVLSAPVSAPGPKPGAKQGVPPTTHTVLGKSDDSFGELAHLYYGITGSGSGTVALIAAANPGLHNGNIAKGTKVTIPKLVNPRYVVATAATRSLVAIAAKNSVSTQRVHDLNPLIRSWPVAIGTRVRVA